MTIRHRSGTGLPSVSDGTKAASRGVTSARIELSENFQRRKTCSISASPTATSESNSRLASKLASLRDRLFSGELGRLVVSCTNFRFPSPPAGLCWVRRERFVARWPSIAKKQDCDRTVAAEAGHEEVAERVIGPEMVHKQPPGRIW